MNSAEEDEARRDLEERLGCPITIVSEMDAEECDLVICVSGQRFYFRDNIFTVCADCGGAIQHRPHVPKKPPKVCMGCASKRMKADGGGVMEHVPVQTQP